MLSAAIESLLFANALTNDLKSYLIEINEDGKSKQNQSQATKKFTDFVDNHALMIQLSDES